jgi:hypothetical protein
MNGPYRSRIEQLFAEGDAIDRALRRAVQEALRRHKLLGQSVAVWKDGRPVVLPPEEIPLEDEGEETPRA